jgi:leucyl aminopeptidase
MPFETAVLPAAPAGFDTPLLAVAMTRGALPASLTALDQATGGALGRLLAAGDFSGKKDETALVYPPGATARVLLVGLGKPEEVSRTAIRRAASTAAKRARSAGVVRAAFHLPSEALGAVTPAEAGQAMAEGLAQGAWQYTEMKRPPEEKKAALERMDILAANATAAVAEGSRVGAAIGAGQALARGIQVLPGNVCTPSYVARTAEEIAGRYGFGITVLDKAAIVREGMGALMAVAQGSAEEPRFIALEYQGAEGPPVVLVGKGVTFDTGGISIKPAQNMEDMKYDMSGAAAVLGTFETMGRLKPPVHVVGLVPSTENMPSGTAVKPGDVVKSMSGKYIEIINTDAEGRLVLADVLAYARRYKPAAVVDAATLTGACVIALGHTATGVMGNDAALVQEVISAGSRAGEPGWELPMWDDFKELIKSDVADVKNSGGRPAGTITAALFLKEFADEYPWVHLDVAGTAYTESDLGTVPRGPTGIPVGTFVEVVRGRAG